MTDDHKKMSRRAFGKRAGVAGIGLLGLLTGCGNSHYQPWERQDAGTPSTDDVQWFEEQDAGATGTDPDGNPVEITIDDRLLTSAREGGMLGFNNDNGQAYDKWLPVLQGEDNYTAANVRINDLTGAYATSMSTFDLAQRYVAGGESGAAESEVMLRQGLIDIFTYHLEDMIGDTSEAEDHAVYMLDKLMSSYNSGNDQGLKLDENGTVNYALIEEGAEGTSGTLPDTIGALFIPVKIDGNKRMLTVYGGANSVLGMDHEQGALFDNAELTTYVQDMIDDANTGF